MKSTHPALIKLVVAPSKFVTEAPGICISITYEPSEFQSVQLDHNGLLLSANVWLWKEFGDDCPPVDLVGYVLTLRGSWAGKTEVAIHSSLTQCASLCSSDPTCQRFSIHLESGVCSHYRKKAVTPMRSDSCTYAFTKARFEENCAFFQARALQVKQQSHEEAGLAEKSFNPMYSHQ